MTELKVSLDFACSLCGQTVGVTVQCSGKVFKIGPVIQVATVHVPCPSCGQVNQLSFDPNGQVRSVEVSPVYRLVPEPSLN